MDFGDVTNYLSTRRPCESRTHNHRHSLSRTVSPSVVLIRKAAAWVPAFAGTTRERARAGPSNLAVDVPLHPVGHLDQAPPGPLEERHHAVHVTVARQRNFDLALALGHLRLALLQRIRFRQRLFDLAGHRGLARG